MLKHSSQTYIRLYFSCKALYIDLVSISCIVQQISFLISHLQDALRTFLLRKLDNLTKDDKCQITMISTWATELYLDKVLALVLDM